MVRRAGAPAKDGQRQHGLDGLNAGEWVLESYLVSTRRMSILTTFCMTAAGLTFSMTRKASPFLPVNSPSVCSKSLSG